MIKYINTVEEEKDDFLAAQITDVKRVDDVWRVSEGNIPLTIGAGLKTTTLDTPSYSGIIQLLLDLSKQVRDLHVEVKGLRSELENRAGSFSLQISTLNNDKLNVVKPISITVEESEEESIVCWPEVNVFGFGSVLTEAIIVLKKNIVDIYFDITAREKKELGEIAIETLSTLKTYLSEKG